MTVLVAVLAWGLLPGSVGAHAALVWADPTPDMTLDRAPVVLTLRFDQPLQAGYAAVAVYDAGRRPVKVAPDPTDPADPFALIVGMPATPTGTYTVVWRALGADGFAVRGAFTYTVALPGDPPPAPVAGLPLAAVANANAPSFLAVFLRGLRDAGIAALIGGIGVFLICLSLALAPLPGEARGRLRRALDERLRRWCLGAVGVALGAHLLALPVQVATARDTTLGAAVRAAAMLAYLRETAPGAVWRGQAALLLALGAWLAFLPLLARRAAQDGRSGRAARPTAASRETAMVTPLWGWAVAFVVGLGLLLVTVFDGHAIAVRDRPVLAFVAGWGHLIAASLWFGGLILIVGPFPAALRALTGQERSRATAAIIGRFSALALGSLGVLAATGAPMAPAYTTRGTLGATAYGLALAGKVALVAVLVALAALNAWSLRRRRGMRVRGMVAAVVLGVAVIGLSGLIAQLPPASTQAITGAAAVAVPPAPSGVIVAQPEIAAEGVRARLTVETAGAETTVTAAVTDDTGTPRADVTGVTLWLNSGDRDIGQITVPMQSAGAGRYRATGQWLAIGQNWLARLVVQRQGTAETILPFVFQPRPTAYAEEPVSASILWPRLLPAARLGVVPLALGVVLLAVALAARLRRAGATRGRWWRAAVAGAMGCALAGLLIAAWYSVPTTPLTGRANPQPATADVLAQGQALYAQTCAACHGAGGAGNGTPGSRLPADLATRYTDGDVYWLITNGVPGKGMPPLSRRLSPAERWQVVRFLRAMPAAAPS